MSLEAMAELENSELLSPDCPRRPGLSHAQVARDPAAYRRAVAGAAPPLVASIQARQAIEALGRSRHQLAVPLLIQFWSTCPARDVWIAAGEALLAIGTPDALAALSAHLDEYDPDGRLTQIAVRAIFHADPARAYDRLAGCFDPERLAAPGGWAAPFRVIKALGPIGADADGALRWVDPGAQEWFRADSRWLDLCVALRRERQLRDIIAHVLDYADPAQLAVAVAREQARAKPGRPPRRAAAGDLVTRYRQGAHVEVWRELRRFEAVDGAMREEALAVAGETMRRVALCCDLAAERLRAAGWKALFGRLRTPPAPDLSAQLADLERAARSPVPPSLMAFWQVVGGVDFVWDFGQGRAPPVFGLDLPLDEMDPLAVDSASASIAAWIEGRSQGDLDTPSRLWLAPDRLRKTNTGDGDPYGVDLPFRGADPAFDGEPHGLAFVDYLRLALRWGGFPGLAERTGSPAVQSFASRMTANFEPF